jgi:hypothetical protein
LYKYRRVDEFLEDLLVRHQIFCSSPFDFNDPFECQPVVRLDISNPKGKKWLRDAADRRGISPARRLGLASQFRHRFAQPIPGLDVGLERITKAIGLYSLSASPDNLLMWAHYSDSHKGVCVEFDTRSWPFNLAWRVHYSRQYPVVDRAQQSILETLQASVLTKAESWSYEQEWRVMMRTLGTSDLAKVEGRSDKNAQWLRQQHGPGLYPIPGESITSVVFGIRATSRDQEKVQDWMLQGRLHAVTKHARQGRDEFRIDIE